MTRHLKNGFEDVSITFRHRIQVYITKTANGEYTIWEKPEQDSPVPELFQFPTSSVPEKLIVGTVTTPI